jgi:hypothetical protein
VWQKVKRGWGIASSVEVILFVVPRKKKALKAGDDTLYVVDLSAWREAIGPITLGGCGTSRMG